MRTSMRKIAFLALIALAFAALVVTLTGGLALAQDAPGGPPPGMREGMERPGMMREGRCARTSCARAQAIPTALAA